MVVMAVDDLESLEETLDILRDEAVMRELAQAERDVATDDTLDAAALQALLEKRRLAS